MPGFGRGIPSRAEGGRGGRWSSSTGGGAVGRRPMPWVELNGLLPGRGAPGRGAGLVAVSAAGASGSAAGAGSGVATGAATTSGSTVGAAAGAFGPGRGPGIGPEVSGAATAGAALSTGAAAFLAGAFLAAAASALARSSAPKRSSNFLTTGGSTLDDAALTYSPMSVSIVITSALLMPYCCASCETRIFAGGATFSSWSSTGGGRGPLVGLHAHREVLIAGS